MCDRTGDDSDDEYLALTIGSAAMPRQLMATRRHFNVIRHLTEVVSTVRNGPEGTGQMMSKLALRNESPSGKSCAIKPSLQ
jgi:hypothetical protein